MQTLEISDHYTDKHNSGAIREKLSRKQHILEPKKVYNNCKTTNFRHFSIKSVPTAFTGHQRRFKTGLMFVKVLFSIHFF